MRRMTLTLTDEEYALLETQAQAQRRSVREMASFLVTRPQPTVIVMPQPMPMGPALITPIRSPNVWGGTTDASRLPDSVYTISHNPLRVPTAGHQA